MEVPRGGVWSPHRHRISARGVRRHFEDNGRQEGHEQSHAAAGLGSRRHCDHHTAPVHYALSPALQNRKDTALPLWPRRQAHLASRPSSDSPPVTSSRASSANRSLLAPLLSSCWSLTPFALKHLCACWHNQQLYKQNKGCYKT